MNTLNKLKQIAQQATQGAWKTDAGGGIVTADKLPNEIYGPIAHAVADFEYISCEDKIHIATFSPQTVLALLELLELYRDNCLTEHLIAIGHKEAALIAKIEESLK